MSADELVEHARSRAISQLRDEGQMQWFTSGPDEGGKTYSLHVHEINGWEPAAGEFKQIAEMLGVQIAQRAEVKGKTFEDADYQP
jgi:hypothetical protein